MPYKKFPLLTDFKIMLPTFAFGIGNITNP